MVLEKNNDNGMNRGSDSELSALLTQFTDGDRDAFRRIVELVSDRLFTYALSHTGDREDSLDIVQETLIDLWSSRRTFQYQGNEAFYAFLFTILKRRLARYHKAKRKTVPLDEEHEALQYTLEVEDYRYVLRAIRTLGKDEQELIALRYWSEMTFKEIAAILDITENAAKVRHHRALRRLGQILP